MNVCKTLACNSQKLEHKCSSAGEGTKECCLCLHHRILISNERSELYMYSTTWMNLKITMLRRSDPKEYMMYGFHYLHSSDVTFILWYLYFKKSVKIINERMNQSIDRDKQAFVSNYLLTFNYIQHTTALMLQGRKWWLRFSSYIQTGYS